MTAPTCGTRFIADSVKRASSLAAMSRSSTDMLTTKFNGCRRLAADLVNRVAVIAATGGGASVRAAKGATTAIPISRASTVPKQRRSSNYSILMFVDLIQAHAAYLDGACPFFYFTYNESLQILP
jgi:hypothetical protein